MPNLRGGRSCEEPPQQYAVFLAACTCLGTGAHNAQGTFQQVPMMRVAHVRRTADWLAWHMPLIDRFVLYIDKTREPALGDAVTSALDASMVGASWRSQLQFVNTTGAGFGVPKLNAYISDLYAACAQRLNGQARWVAFIDQDEYIYPRQHFVKALQGLRCGVDWVYLLWETVCDNASLPLRQTLHGNAFYPHSFRYSGKSIIRPEFFRDARHMGRPLITNGIVSSKVNTIHKFTPLPRVYNQSEREVLFSRTPADVWCGSGEVGYVPCREVRRSHALRHLRANRAYRKAQECHVPTASPNHLQGQRVVH